MGYTHYFKVSKAPKGKASQFETKYQTAIKQCQRIILAWSKVNGGLSGFSAHTKLGQYGGINLNGSERVGQCETFVLREHLSQNEAFSFCKTRQYPYDTVVVACLIVMHHYLGTVFAVSSDGNASDWDEGLKLARKILRIKTIQMPESIRDEAQSA